MILSSLRFKLSIIAYLLLIIPLSAQDFGFVLIKSIPENAQVIINGRNTGQRTPYQARLDTGVYNFTLKLAEKNYYDYRGHFEIKTNKTSTVQADLKPNFGNLFVESNPSGATISIGDTEIGKTPLTIRALKSGVHTITLSKTNYNTLVQNVVIEDDETTRLTLDLEAGYGTVGIRVVPDDASIYIDGNYKKNGFFSGQLTEGSHTIDVKLEKYYPVEKDIMISEGTEIPMLIELKPITGSLSIMVDPPETDVYLEGAYKGLSPMVISDLLIGQYSLELKKDGYANLKKTVEIEESNVIMLEEKMFDGYNIIIKSDPDGATVFKDEQEIGITPADVLVESGVSTFLLKKKFYFDKLIDVTAAQNDQVVNTTLDRTNSNVYINANISGATVDLESKDNLLGVREDFSIPGGKTVPAGNYELTITKKGFKTVNEEIEIGIDGFNKGYNLYPIEYRNKGGALWRSVLWPGSGQSWIKRKGAEPLLGVAAWGFFASGTYMYIKADKLYNEYLESESANEREKLIGEYRSSKNQSEKFLIAAGAIWGANMIWTILMPSEEKRYRNLELAGNVDLQTGVMQVGFVVKR